MFLLYDRSAPRSYQSLLALLQSQLVCRQYYAETKLLVFQINKLAANLTDLKGLLEMIPKDVQNAISTLYIYGYSDRDPAGSLFPLSSLVNFRRFKLYPQGPRLSSPYRFFKLFTNKNGQHIEEKSETFLYDEWHRILIDAGKIGEETCR